MIAWENVSCGYRGRPVLSGLSLRLEPGNILGLLGPNGCGKTTILKTSAGIIPPLAGRILLDGRPLPELTRREASRCVAVVPQDLSMLFPFTVRETVMMGRFPHQSALAFETGRDREAVAAALEATDTARLRDRRVTEISGGERLRVFLARALAQEPRLLLLDEPTAFLDLRYQVELYQLVRRLCHERALAVILACHDVNLVSRYATRLLFLKDGKARAEGPPDKVLTEELLFRVYGVKGRLFPIPDRPGEPPIFVASA